MLTGCGGLQPPIAGPSGITPTVRERGANGWPGRSWMLPEAKNSELLYVTDARSNEVTVLELPKGKLLGVIDGFDSPAGECSDAKGNVYVVNFEVSQIWKFKHAALTPEDILNDPDYGPVGCSVDPTSGDLAVTNEIKISGTIAPGNVAIYAHASGKPSLYFDASIYQFGFCAYDDSGNLYAGGSTSGANSFAELRKGASALTPLKLDENISGESAMQWDGKNLAIVAGYPGSLVYRFKIKGGSGTADGALQLRGAKGIEDFALQGKTLYAPMFSQNEVGGYPYPHGGKASKIFYGLGGPGAAAVSLPQ